MSERVDLTNFADGFSKTSSEYKPEDKPFDDSPIPDGKYQVKVERTEVVKSLSNRPMLKWTLLMLEEKYKNRKLWKNCLLDNEIGYKILLSDLHICGVSLPHLTELYDKLNDLLDIKLEVYVKNTPDGPDGQKRYNVFFNKFLGRCEPAEDVAGELTPF